MSTPKEPAEGSFPWLPILVFATVIVGTALVVFFVIR